MTYFAITMPFTLESRKVLLGISRIATGLHQLFRKPGWSVEVMSVGMPDVVHTSRWQLNNSTKSKEEGQCLCPVNGLIRIK